jgi:hypothetical protein
MLRDALLRNAPQHEDQSLILRRPAKLAVSKDEAEQNADEIRRAR